MIIKWCMGVKFGRIMATGDKTADEDQKSETD
jgi:hypothetical protein